MLSKYKYIILLILITCSALFIFNMDSETEFEKKARETETEMKSNPCHEITNSIIISIEEFDLRYALSSREYTYDVNLRLKPFSGEKFTPFIKAVNDLAILSSFDSVSSDMDYSESRIGGGILKAMRWELTNGETVCNLEGIYHRNVNSLTVNITSTDKL